MHFRVSGTLVKQTKTNGNLGIQKDSDSKSDLTFNFSSIDSEILPSGSSFEIFNRVSIGITEDPSFLMLAGTVRIMVCSRSVALIIIDPLSEVKRALPSIGIVDLPGIILDNFCRDTCRSVFVIENFIVNSASKVKYVYIS